MCRVLFVYPNKEGYPIIPLGIAILAGVLRKNGHMVDLFDVTFLVQERLDQKARERTQVVKAVNTTEYWGVTENEDVAGLFKKKIKEFNPDLIAFSVVENNYSCARELFKVAKTVMNVPIVVGGVFPTVAPDVFLQDTSVDIICLGEGEYALLELANRLSNNKDYTDINNLIVKYQGRIFRNEFFPFYNWKPQVLPAWDIFDKRHMYKPFVGKVWRTGFFELSRGCPSRCAYCATRIYQEVFKSIGLYRREKSVEIFKIETCDLIFNSKFDKIQKRRKIMQVKQSGITIKQDTRFGKPCIRGTRVAIADIIDLLRAGYQINEIPKQYPEITENDVKIALRYAVRILEKEEILDIKSL